MNTSADRVSPQTGWSTPRPLSKTSRDGFVIPRDTGSGGDHFTLDNGVELSTSGRGILRRIAELYHIRTCGTLKVNSGTRTPNQQAKAMWNNLYYNRNRNVHDMNRQAFAEIHEAYLEGRRSGAGEKDTVDAMTSVIEQQVRNGTYISLHLKGEAVDILPNSNPPLQPKVLEEVVKELLGSGHCIPEEDHFHIQFGS